MSTRFVDDEREEHGLALFGFRELEKRNAKLNVEVVADALDVFQRTMLFPDFPAF
jgi:hypothetical protein